MATTSARMLRLLSLLQTHRYWAGSDLAGRLGVSQRTLRRDVDRLRDLGYPVNANRGVAGGYQLDTGGELPPLLLDEDEAIAIAVGLRTAATGAVAGMEETSVRALTKLLRMLSPRLRRRVDALGEFTAPAVFGGGPTVAASDLATIAQACRDHERLRFAYTDRGGVAGTRLVEPDRLVTVGRRWYLVAWDVDRADWRTFRVDRLSDPRSTRYRSEPRTVPGGDAVAFVNASLSAAPTRYEIEVVVGADAATVKDMVGGWGSVEALDDGTCRLRMGADELRWPAMVLAAVGAEFRVVTPVELRDEIRRIGALFGQASA
jgi:predicted DNA-binding transcriptional regulator YafY